MTQASRPLAIAGQFDVNAIRRDFPLLARSINGKPLAYLDNAASSQRPLAVIEAREVQAAEEQAAEEMPLPDVVGSVDRVLHRSGRYSGIPNFPSCPVCRAAWARSTSR